jgi:alkanesulfonate monooxygenase SsuD/methylene tetrahydromethanopterin reductase-like flavin-dependent oxidoreductase (luciferase family)
MTVRFGLLQLFESPEGRSERQFLSENLELVEFADQVGLDEVWLAEHHFSDYGVMPSTQVFGSHIAARTRRLRIGTAVVVLPFHNPVRVAEEFAFIDLLSEGRLDLGVGRGYQPAEFRGYGVPMETSRERFDESLEVIRRAWSEDELSFEGKHFRFDRLKIRPRPLQRPHPPLFGASFNPDTIRHQAEKKLNLLYSALLAPPEKIGEYRRILRESGEDPDRYRVGGLVFVYLDEDRERALRDFEKPCMWYFKKFAAMVPAKQYPDTEGYYRDLHGTITSFISGYESGAISFRQICEEGPFRHAFLVGDPELVSERLEALLGAYEGTTEVLCWTRLGGLDHRLVMRSMDLLVRRVVQPMRERGRFGAGTAARAAAVG